MVLLLVVSAALLPILTALRIDKAFRQAQIWHPRSFPTKQQAISNQDCDVAVSDSFQEASTSVASLKEMGIDIAEVLKSSRSSIPYRVGSKSDMFCNRELNMQQIMAIGFDMDYTLAQYTIEFDLLAYNGAKEKLVNWLGYPEEVLDFVYKQDIARRGCMIDKSRGNILKLDQHRYVRAVEHGLTALSKSDRKSIYRESFQEAEKFTGKEFSNIDTPFSLVDACLFAQLVDLKDRTAMKGVEGSMLSGKRYMDLWTDMRRCVDRCHKDGVIKLTVAQDPEKYIIFDEQVMPMLQGFRDRGLKVFLLTNSLWDYTQVVMNYLEGKKTSQDNNLDFKWTEYFDLIVVGGNKPAFLLDENSLSIYRINGTHGTLQNVETPPADGSDDVADFIAKTGKIYQGGNAQILHRLLDIPSGDRLLYVGDHIFSDVVRSKRSLNWRTCLIVPELVEEIRTYQSTRTLRKKLMDLRKREYMLENQLNALHVKKLQQQERDAQKQNPDNKLTNSNNINTKSSSARNLTSQGGDDGISSASSISSSSISGISSVSSSCEDQLVAELAELRVEVRRKVIEYDQHFHPRWGQLFKAGFQESMISKQIQDFACIYTSKASNLGSVSPMRLFRPGRDFMAHDHLVNGL